MKILLITTLYLSQLLALDFSKHEDYMFKNPALGMQTEASVIWHDGKIIYEKYEKGDANTLHLLWSMTKSISSILFGIAEDKGIVSREDKLTKYFPKEIESLSPKLKEHYNKLQLKHFLHMTSGLAWNEFYEEDPFNSHVVNMLYEKSKGSIAQYVLQTPIRRAPGEYFYYSSGDTNVFMAAIKRALPKPLKDNYPWEWLFNPMEMDAIFEQDLSGTFVGSSYAYLKTKDLLKLGELILNKGMYKNQQIVSKEYLEYAVGLSPYLKDNCLKDYYMTYGAQFWLNHNCLDGNRPFPRIPSDLIMLLGHGGQSIFIIPSLKLVAVRIARDDNNALDKTKYTLNLIHALTEDK